MPAVGSGDIGGSEAGRASPKPMQIGSTRATLQVPSALTGTRRATLLGPLQAPSALTGEQLGEVLDSLRELQSVHMNLGLLQRSGVLAFADSLKQCPVSVTLSCANDQCRSSFPAPSLQ